MLTRTKSFTNFWDFDEFPVSLESINLRSKHLFYSKKYDQTKKYKTIKYIVPLWIKKLITKKGTKTEIFRFFSIFGYKSFPACFENYQ